MKIDNRLIKITNKDSGEYRYFTKDSYVQLYIGCSQSSIPQIKTGATLKYKNWKYELVDGSQIKWKDINIL